MTAPHSASTVVESPSSFPLRVFFGHHKCATGWTGGIMREISLHMGRTFEVINRRSDYASDSSLGAFVKSNNVEVLSYANADLQEVRSLPPFVGFHMVRDPRDVLVSAYFSHKKTHSTREGWPELVEHRALLQSVSKDDGLMAEMDFSACFFEDMMRWDYDQANVLEVKMEDVTASPIQSFTMIAEFLDILDGYSTSSIDEFIRRFMSKSNRLNHRGRRFMPGNVPLIPAPRYSLSKLSPAVLSEIIETRSFERLTGRSRGQENRGSHLRKGLPGDWKNHFKQEHTEAFKDRYNDLILKLGYEDTPDWSR